MKYLLYLLILLLIIGLGFGLLVPLHLAAVIPGLLLVPVVCIAAEYGSLDFLVFAIIGGIWLDLWYGLPVGSFSAILLLIGMFNYLIFHYWLFLEVTGAYYVGSVALSTALFALWPYLYSGFLYRLHWSSLFLSWSAVWRHGWPMVLWNIVLAFPVYFVINSLLRQWRAVNRQSLELR